MSLMANLMEALVSYQQTLRNEMPLDSNALDAESYLKRDGEVSGAKRFDYLKFVNGEVQTELLFSLRTYQYNITVGVEGREHIYSNEVLLLLRRIWGGSKSNYRYCFS